MADIGDTHTVEDLVDESRTAHALGNEGVRVLGTPALVNVLEIAAHRILMRDAPAGRGTVGTAVNIRHLKATPEGMLFSVRATLAKVDGRRCRFNVEGHDEEGQIVSGTHERFLVDLQRFLERTGGGRQR